MTTDELFNQITKEIALPHTTITRHDKKVALEIMLLCADFLRYNEEINVHIIAKNLVDKVNTIEDRHDEEDDFNEFVKNWEAIKV